jgi:hypothetical protein
MIQEALKLHNQGLKVCFTTSPKKKGGKAPIGLWRDFIDGVQTEKDVKKLYDYAKTKEDDLGLAIICDAGLEVLDIDSKYFLESHSVEYIFDAIIEAIGVEAYESIIQATTVNGGYHMIYRSAVVEGSQKLASRYTEDHEKKNEHDKVRVLLETRAHGGIFVVAPTEGYKYDNPFKTAASAPTLSIQQRNALINACRAFDELEDSYKQTKVSIPTEITISNKSTIEHFNESHTPIEFLEAAGWQYKYSRGNNSHYVRPGKGLSEGIGAGYHEDLNLVRIFTSSTEFEPNKTYNAFQVYSILNHAGDYKEASRELYKAGYGDRISKQQETHAQKVSQITSMDKNTIQKISNDDLMNKIFDNRLDITVKPTKKPNSLFLEDDFGNYIGVGGDGDLVNIFGGKKSRKSAIAACAASTSIIGGHNTSLKFKGDFGNRNLVHFDTEQNAYYHHKLCGEMIFQAGLTEDSHPTNFYSFHLMPYSKIDRLNFIRYSLEKIDNIGCVFLDGIVDVCRNYNDLEESSDLVTFFMNMASQRKFLIIDVLHNARSTGSARGHLGTELMNKATCNLNVLKDKDKPYSTLEVESIRGAKAPEPFDFHHNDFGHLELY